MAVVGGERAGAIFGKRVAVALAVRGTHEGRDDVEAPLADAGGLAPEIREPEVDVELEKVDSRGAGCHGGSVERGSDSVSRLQKWLRRCISGPPTCRRRSRPTRRSRSWSRGATPPARSTS